MQTLELEGGGCLFNPSLKDMQVSESDVWNESSRENDSDSSVDSNDSERERKEN